MKSLMIRPFQLWQYELGEMKNLSKDDKKWYKNFINEYLSGDFRHSKKNNIHANPVFLESILSTIKDDSELLEKFKAKKEKENKQISDIDFLFLEVKREIGRKPHRERFDVFAQSSIVKESKMSLDEQETKDKIEFIDHKENFTEFESEFLNAIKTDSLPEFISEHLLYAVELLYIKNRSIVFKTLLNDIQEQKESFDKNELNKNDFQLYMIKTISAIKSFKFASEEANNVLDKLIKIYNNYLYNKKTLKQKIMKELGV